MPSEGPIASVSKHISNTEANWGTSHFKLASLSSQVTTLSFVAHANPDNAGDPGLGLPPTNHWSFALGLVDSDEPNCKSFVSVDVLPNEPGEPGMLCLENIDALDDAIHKVSFDLSVSSGTTHVTVADVLAVLIARKRDHYTCHAVGEGCRFWLQTVASDFAEEGVIPGDVADVVRADLEFYWPWPEGSRPVLREIKAGVFGE